MNSLKRLLRYKYYTTRLNKTFFSFNKFNPRFFTDKKDNNKGSDYGGLNISDKENKEANKKSSENIQGQSTSSGGISQEHSKQTMTDSTLNFMGTGLGEVFRSRNNPIDELIIMDHKDLRVFLQKFEQSSEFEEASKWLHQFIWEICRHSIAEEIILYPMLKKIPDGREIWTESLEEHRKIKEILSHVGKIKDLKLLKAKVQECSEILMHHIDNEEKEILPAINSHFNKQDLINEGNRFLRRKFIAPTRPHTMAPDSIPTLESLVGLLVAPIDKFRDIFMAPFPDQVEVEKIKKDNTQNPKS